MADDLEDLARGRLLVLRLRQALLKIADLGVLVFPRLAGNTRLCFALCGFWTPTHQPLLASSESAGDRLGEGVHMDKGEVMAVRTVHFNPSPPPSPASTSSPSRDTSSSRWRGAPAHASAGPCAGRACRGRGGSGRRGGAPAAGRRRVECRRDRGPR